MKLSKQFQFPLVVEMFKTERMKRAIEAIKIKKEQNRQQVNKFAKSSSILSISSAEAQR